MKHIIEEALETFGEESQMLKLAEECNELSASIVRYINKKDPRTTMDNLVEEFVDVEICLEYMANILEKHNKMEQIDEVWKAKMARLELLLKRG